MTYNDAKALEGLLSRFLRGIAMLENVSPLNHEQLNASIYQARVNAESALDTLRFGTDIVDTDRSTDTVRVVRVAQ